MRYFYEYACLFSLPCLGTYVTEQLRKDYPECIIVNQVIWPFEEGEVVIQNYNMLLTLAKLYKVSGIFRLALKYIKK